MIDGGLCYSEVSILGIQVPAPGASDQGRLVILSVTAWGLVGVLSLPG